MPNRTRQRNAQRSQITTLENAVNSADQSKVITAAASLFSLSSSWPVVAATSPLLAEPVPDLTRRNFGTTVPPHLASDFTHYLALSSFAHLIDGWRYLSQASIAAMRGSRREGIHIAYYAELRAAMSILAGFGISINNGHNYSVNSSNNIQWFEGATHPTTWKAIKTWSENPAYSQDILSSIDILGIDGSKILQAGRASQSADAITSKWISEWAFDLTRLSDDRLIRNDASYNVDFANDAHDPLKLEELNLIMDASKAFSPDLYETSDSLNAAIMYSMCQSAQRATGKSRVAFWEDMITDLHLNHGITLQMAKDIIDVIKGAQSGHAMNLITNSDRRNKGFTGIFSRALLMLKLASALKSHTWASVSRIASSNGADWQLHALDSIGIASGMWDPDEPPSNYIDLDEDYTAALDDISEWLAGPSPFKQYTLWQSHGLQLVKLSQFERIPIWEIAR